ncbi:hypothetical protein OS493_015549 [Desmophyllum pertusum]|uniref:CABIT domain-containing protein n=1 Tax=Desmophyllum pertusum TaxID=174260 RepID=A0A9W9YP82_9CNID|nr:hypothetical protein OS493_015549 [Desmophyllum pertusum]
MTAPSATSYKTRFYRLDEFITMHESALPQIVKVGKGFYEKSVNRSIETGELLIIFKIEGKKKILAQHLSSGREICFPRTCNLTVEMAAESSQDVYSSLDALVQLPSRYVRVLENIPSFGLLAGDVLQLSREPPYSNGNDVRCLVISLKDPVYVDLPASIKESFSLSPTMEYTPSRKCLKSVHFRSTGTEYKQLVNAIENDKLLQDKLNADCLYFTSDPVRRYSLERLQFVSFPFDKKQRIYIPPTENRTAKGLKQDVIVTEDGFCQLGFDSPAQPQKVALTSEVRDKIAPLQLRSKQRDAASKMQILDDSFCESEEAILLASYSERKAYESQLDVDANVAFTPGVLIHNKHKQTLADLLEPTQTVSPCNLSRSLPGIKPETTDEDSRPRLPRKPLIFMENDFSQDFTTDTSEKTTRREQCKVHKMQKYDGSSSEQSDEENNNIDNLDLTSPENLSDSYSANMQYGRQGNVETAERVRREEVKSSEGECSANGDNPKRGFFHSLTRKPRWFRQDASKPDKKDRGQVIKTKSKDVKIPARHHAASCEDILISSPREDDFECVLNIKKYLETQDKLSKALVEITRLQKQGSNDSETATKPENKEMSNVPIKSSDETGKPWQRKQSELEGLKDSQDMFSKQTSNPNQDKAPSSTPVHASAPEDPDVSGLPVSHCLAMKQSDTTWPSRSTQDNHRRLETNSRRFGMSHNRPALAVTDEEDSESVTPPSYSLQRDNAYGQLRILDHSGRQENAEDREPRHEDSSNTCSCCRSHFTDVFGVELTESAAKDELKKAILQMNWSEDEWMELTEMVRRKINHANRIHVPYENLAHHERHGNLSMAEPNEESMHRRLETPPYVNITQGFGRTGTPPYQNITPDTRQGSGNDMQRLANRSLGKPPIPTPRSGRSSI